MTFTASTPLWRWRPGVDPTAEDPLGGGGVVLPRYGFLAKAGQTMGRDHRARGALGRPGAQSGGDLSWTRA